ncbi:MAG: hypothetical protein FNT15_03330 [Sulfurovum sp.]|jgi:hypothetical protein|nr:MAG: hypothetical protein FNT15_03330 [Sulfurovum sp.]
MRKLFLCIIISALGFADGMVEKIDATVQEVQSDGKIVLNVDVPKGMSGVVIHNYGNNLEAITHNIVSNGGKTAQISNEKMLENSKLPDIQTPIKNGDKVLIGQFYKNMLIIAPNAQVYNFLANDAQKKLSHPDEYAVYLLSSGEKPMSLESFKKFAKLNSVGLIGIVTSNAFVTIDAMSSQILSKTTLKDAPKESINPFYLRFDTTSKELFGKDLKDNNYYELVKAFE